MKTETALDQLRRGYLPTPVELERIQTDLASLSTELARLDAQIRDLVARRDSVKKQIDLQQAIISPIRRIPDDVVQEIFLACLPTHQNAAMSPREAPLLLCQIISTWRALALCTPPLWSSLHVPLEFAIQTKERARAVAKWLERYTGYPLSLSITGVCGDGRELDVSDIWANPKFDANQILMTTSSESTSRWREITLTMLPIEYIHEFYCASAPLLQDLRITESRLPAKDWRDLFTLPSVRTLSLQGLIINKHAPELLDAFSNITHLSFPATLDARGVCQSVQGISGKLLVGILRNLPELVSLEAYIKDLELRATKVTKLAALTSLFLHARFIDLPVVDHFLDYLIMPKLRNLRVAANPSALPFLPFSSLRQGSPLIQQLDIDSGAFSKEVFREMILNFPSLVKLVFRDGERDWREGPHPANTAYLLTLLSQPAIRRSLPFLKDLEITHTNSSSLPDDTLFIFLHTCLDIGGFRLEIAFLDGVEDVPDVQAYGGRGIDIVLSKTIIAPSSPLKANPWTGIPGEAESANRDS